MRALLRPFACLLAVLGLAAALQGTATAAPVPKALEKTIRTVVQAQLDAFAKNDAKRAFSYAAPDIRKLFGSPERFFTMVQVGYPVVHRPRSVTFLKPEMVDGEVLQPVQMTDENGQPWLATYLMKQQKDKSWRIGGCTVVEDDRLST
ncbi:MAG: DUF4864 domain-containing protein [Pseudomonadota bacterium]